MLVLLRTLAGLKDLPWGDGLTAQENGRAGTGAWFVCEGIFQIQLLSILANGRSDTGFKVYLNRGTHLPGDATIRE